MKPKTKNGTMTAKFSAADVKLWQAMRRSLTTLQIIEQGTLVAGKAGLLRRAMENIMAERVPDMEALAATQPDEEPDADAD